MAAKDLSRNPHNVTDNLWWYEESRGVELVLRVTDNQGGYLRTEQHTISWDVLRRALARKDKPAQPKGNE